MRGFQANNCRLCQKVFCCKQCRIKHEKNIHKVFPDCDICVYGKFFFGNFDDCFLQHLEFSHLPVQCLYCRKVFGSVEDLLHHKKCDYFQNKEISPKTPLPFKIGTPPILISTDDQDSPVLQDLQRHQYLNSILATSTPMQRGEEVNIMFEKSKEVIITPVDKPSRVANKSIIKKTDSVKSDDNLSKRRVTFGETPSNPFEKNNEIAEASDRKTSCKNTSDNSTPVTGMTTGQFYSAKTETGQFYSAKTDVSSKPLRDNSHTKSSLEGFTPVGVPNRSKLNNLKGDIYKNQDQDDSLENKLVVEYDNKNEINLDEVSMELCTPAKQLNAIENNQENIIKVSVTNDTLSMTDNVNNTEESVTENVLDLFTPAKASNPVNILADIYRDSQHESIPPVAEEAKQSEEIDKTDNHNKSENDLEAKVVVNSDTVGYDTLWLTATNLEETSDSEEQNKENTQPNESSKQNQEEHNSLDSPASPQRNNERRVSVVMPTPILKTTNVQMKFHFPAHLSSTPIMSSGAIKLKQTEMIKDISTRVIQQQTPYKTPQGKLYEFVQRKLVDASIRRTLAPLQDVEAGPSTARQDILQLEDIKENSSPDMIREYVHEPVDEEYEDKYSALSSYESKSGVSVSSMTESSLWSSMTKIVKSVFGGFSNLSQNSNSISTDYDTNNSSKRQLSDSDTGDYLEAPRLKRFKFTDIKCRRPIRDLPALELPRSLPGPRPLASIEIVRSVSTVYGGQTMKILCDKATQTDDYLMYGWHPHS